MIIVHFTMRAETLQKWVSKGQNGANFSNKAPHFEFNRFSLLDYTCRARWPEGLLCSTISLKSCNLAQILQSPKSEIVTCVMFSTHTNTSLIKPHLTELDEIHRNRPKSNYNLAKKLQSWSVTSDRHQTDRPTDRDSHIFYLVPPCRSRTQ